MLLFVMGERQTYRHCIFTVEIRFVIAEEVFATIFCQDASKDSLSIYLSLSHCFLVAVNS